MDAAEKIGPSIANFRMERSLLKELDSTAIRMGLTRSEIMRIALREGLVIMKQKYPDAAERKT